MTCKDALPIATMRALETALARALGADRVSIGESRRLSGGAIQENWMRLARRSAEQNAMGPAPGCCGLGGYQPFAHG